MTASNAHPHLSERDGLAICVVHNGIIENHDVLRESLSGQGYVFQSETDTEVIAHLIHRYRQGCKSLRQAVHEARQQLKGAYAIAVMSSQDPQELVGTRQGAPLLLGLTENQQGMFLASDTSALLQVTRNIVYLEDGDLVRLTDNSAELQDAQGKTIHRKAVISSLSADDVELGPHAHYMHKEILEQPGAVAATLEDAMGAHTLSPGLLGPDGERAISRIRQVLILACGTSFHAGMVARYWIESIARIPVSLEIASEYRYRDSVMLPDTLVIAISQSGETADTLAALQFATRHGAAASLAICNVPESSLMRSCTLRLLTRAGPEIGVASTKAFTTQLASLFFLPCFWPRPAAT